MNVADVYRVYLGSDGEATKALYGRLAECSPAGRVATELFRACKSSERAKVYRGGVRGQGSFRRMAYGRKEWALGNLCTVLSAESEALSLRWGWAIDEAQPMHRHVLYVDLPTGQVSFHTGERGNGPDYAGTWDGVRGQAGGRICSWIGRLLAEAAGDRAA